MMPSVNSPNITRTSSGKLANKNFYLKVYLKKSTYAIGAGSRGAAAPPGDILAPPGRLLPPLRLVSWAIFGTKKRF